MNINISVHLILLMGTIITLSLIKLALPLDYYRYEDCKPKDCGNGLNISYPFWIEKNYCGYPGFNITCKNNEPILYAAGYDYIIRDIHYGNRSFRVENPVAHSSCPVPFRNSTFNDQSPFKLGSGVQLLSFFYICTNFSRHLYMKYIYPVHTSCVTPSDHKIFSLAGFVPSGESLYDRLSCQLSVHVPVEVEPGSKTGQVNGYMPFMKKGFTLEWHKSPCTECQASGGYCGVNKNGLVVCFCKDRPYDRRCKTDPGPRRNKIIIGVCAAIGASLLTVLAFILFRRWRRRNDLHKNSTLISRSISPDLSMQPDPEKGSSYFNTPIFTYKELEEATNNFDSSKELGDGGFGTVYYGKLKDGRAVAVKRLYENNCKRVEQFMNEVNILSLLRHQNLVSLYGCTSRHSRELLLVYEYVANGTVADHLHGEHSSAGMVTWPIRLSIAIESADALVYLHASDIIHRDVKTNNILLDKNFHVKVADFGLSRLFPNDVTHVSTAPQGTPGYVDPDYYQCYQLTDKSDVYSFGVVLCELISSKPAVDINRHRHEINLSTMALNKIHGDALHELVDMSLGFDTNASVRKTVTLVAELAYRCLQQDTDARPSMAEVLEVLKEIEVEGSKVVKPGELTDDAKLLKNYPPVSPNSVTDKWASITSTPNTSS
ncbi:LEAF RUST 10 DISEASE-RESISTANCE LOCUS RECEPTOR-LIKE PROTEIN KINASE-like 1.2 isoform X3 [Papaver somniferum]|uniref:LEAF RUST 10 DISEASE-RESISTANCE LOCUS RECEPTOR-LIKE PROTEIN KINASE-like 1.2 isoform X3 n=1 Tax=Papaver somniferum TaxID=3469 RepID=UPI000E6F6D38|nr:LEAF RUST 10 DISEASE-RESISTANCE LOCUS RECEPTOR-LIKE PROTEIN KINASE-like 1.2 isoform X3 [Papaver somniferum]